MAHINWGRSVSEMLNRVAIVIAEEMLKRLTAHPRPDFDPSALAHAVIEAMREPTPSMVIAAWLKADIPKVTSARGWQLMIDEALKPVPYA